MTKRILLYFALLLWFVVPGSAQPTFYFPNLSAEKGEKVAVDVKVRDFNKILSMQYTFSWDPNVVTFHSIGNFGRLVHYSKVNFGTKFVDQGKLTTSWFDQDLAGITLDDHTTIVTLYFEVVGPLGAKTDLKIASQPTPIEVADADAKVLPINIETGTIRVQASVNTNKPAIQSNDLFTLYQNEPNPFKNQTFIRFDLQSAQQVSLLVYDLEGKLVYSSTKDYPAGTHLIEVSEEQLSKTGAYLYTLKTNDHSLTNKMVLIR